MTDHLNGLDSTIDARGFFERILRERDKLEAERDRRLEQRFAQIEQRFQANDKALELQAEEYARRLTSLNGEYKRDQQRQANYVTIDKYESGIKAEAAARLTEHTRANERFDDYLEMYEKRHREVEEDTRSRTLQSTFEDYKKNETSARDAALLRINEKFEDYVKRYEIRQREIDLTIAAQKGAAEEAKRAAEDQGRKSNRNMAILGLGLTVLVAAANFIPSVVN